jgi:hypothetical protein
MQLSVHRRTLTGIVFLGSLLILWIIEPTPRFDILERSGQNISSLPGTIGIRFRNESTLRTFAIIDEKFVEKSWQIDGPREGNTLTAEKKGAEVAFLGDDVIPRGPFLISPDRSHIVVSVAYKRAKAYDATDFVLAGARTNQIVFQRKDESGRFIDGIAWSGDSRLFAILEHSYKRVLSLRSIISAVSGHPVSSKTFYLMIYDVHGKLISQAKVASGVIGGAAEVFWS